MLVAGSFIVSLLALAAETCWGGSWRLAKIVAWVVLLGTAVLGRDVLVREFQGRSRDDAVVRFVIIAAVWVGVGMLGRWLIGSACPWGVPVFRP